jgi:leucine dehydrogenase
MNTGEADMDVIGERTEYVFGRSVEAGGSGSPALPTAAGVEHGIRASLRHVFASDDVAGKTVLVQGAGGVGSALAERLAQRGASVILTDIDPDRAEAVAAQVHGETVAAERALDVDCDVFAPCAKGGVLSVESAARLRCRIVAGSANNQLATLDAAEAVHERGILYAPDYVINAGGAIAIVGLEQLGWSRADADAALAGIGKTLTQVYELADAQGVSTAVAAEALAEKRLRAGLASSIGATLCAPRAASLRVGPRRRPARGSARSAGRAGGAWRRSPCPAIPRGRDPRDRRRRAPSSRAPRLPRPGSRRGRPEAASTQPGR